MFGNAPGLKYHGTKKNPGVAGSLRHRYQLSLQVLLNIQVHHFNDIAHHPPRVADYQLIGPEELPVRAAVEL